MFHLAPILAVLSDAVLAGAAEIVQARASGSIDSRYKDATELVTTADTRSDAAIRSVFTTRFPAIDPHISFHLEESRTASAPGAKWAGADPLDGTSHFVAGGHYYSVQAHYVEDGVPLVGVVFQPELYLPLQEARRCVGRLVSAIRGEGAYAWRTEWRGAAFHLGRRRRVRIRAHVSTRALVGCVPVSGKMTPAERERARRVQDSGVMGATMGAGGAGGNIMMVVFGGQDVYANFGAGDDLNLIPPQVIAEEAGLVVWGTNRRPPVWHARKQPVVAALTEEAADRVLRAAGF